MDTIPPKRGAAGCYSAVCDASGVASLLRCYQMQTTRYGALYHFSAALPCVPVAESVPSGLETTVLTCPWADNLYATQGVHMHAPEIHNGHHGHLMAYTEFIAHAEYGRAYLMLQHR